MKFKNIILRDIMHYFLVSKTKRLEFRLKRIFIDEKTRHKAPKKGHGFLL